MSPDCAVLGVDFTSAPGRAKPIVVARGHARARAFALQEIDTLPDWAAFERLLVSPGPWIGGFDFPFGLPRAAVHDLGWPAEWEALVRHCAALGRAGLRAAFDAYRARRPAGDKYPHRATDRPAASHSPLKLVNPPVALMFLEGAPRLAAAGLHIPGLRIGDATRVAVEAYPGLAARAITAASYKSDDRRKQTPERRTARAAIVQALCDDGGPFGFRLETSDALRTALVADAGGDSLDAVLAAMQSAWCLNRAGRGFGLPPAIDPLEGWIAMAGAARAPRPVSSRPMEIDALRIALLAVCSAEPAPPHRIHGELEHWLDRPLASAEIDAALAELEARGLLAARRESAPGAFLTTADGRAIVRARWEEFFPA